MPETQLILQFGEDNQVAGSGGCNTFEARYDVTNDNEINITGIVSTSMTCNEDGQANQETQFFESLRTANSFSLSGNALIIRYGDGQGVLNFSKVFMKTPKRVNI